MLPIADGQSVWYRFGFHCSPRQNPYKYKQQQQKSTPDPYGVDGKVCFAEKSLPKDIYEDQQFHQDQWDQMDGIGEECYN
mmetsp:Transcript_43494/g.92469  ORF Transcript_43494/g.92469 Transcript_43494/m.92469 type:complete len:80 (+) Transcript_43494:672-911(+)